MATYAAYRHIELDNVGYSKKRVHSTSSEIFNVMCTPPSLKTNGHSPRRSSTHSDSFTRLFGSPDSTKVTPRRASLTKHDVTNRNPVTGNGVDTWDSRSGRNTPRVRKERNPVTGEVYTVVSPPTTPSAKSPQNGFATLNGNSTLKQNGSATPKQNGSATPKQNGYATPKQNGTPVKLNGVPKMNGNPEPVFINANPDA